MDDISTCLCFFLRVFGRIRAKDIALKFNSKIFDGKNQVDHRATIATLTSKKSNKSTTNNPVMSSDVCVQSHHNEILSELEQLECEHDDDYEATKICTFVGEDI